MPGSSKHALSPTEAALDRGEVQSLRQRHYNAELVDVITVNDELRIFRVVRDGGVLPFEPGQYTVLGLGYWEPRWQRLPDDPHDDDELHRLCKRAYSISCSLLDADTRLMPPDRCPWLEFYVVLIGTADDHAPALTPRLFVLQPGDRLFAGRKATGHFTLRGVGPDNDCVFLATGTGEAPHNAMVAQLLDRGHRGRLVAATCVRRRRDLGYFQAHVELERQFTNYRYVTLTTREPENVELDHVHYVGKRYLQEYVASGDFERDADVSLDPQRTHVFLCGNPAMIGLPQKGPDGRMEYPESPGMMKVLHERGFTADTREQPGNVHFEKYW